MTYMCTSTYAYLQYSSYLKSIHCHDDADDEVFRHIRAADFSEGFSPST